MHFASRADVVLVYQDELSMNGESGPPINVPSLLTVFCTRDRVERDDTITIDSHFIVSKRNRFTFCCFQ
jgi:hypothetical protein